MKHVVVLSASDFSGDFISQQRTKDSRNAAYVNSCRIMEHLESNDTMLQAKARKEKDALLSADGLIQFHHFKHMAPRYTHFEDTGEPENRVNHWVARLVATLPQGETIDAVVLPNGIDWEKPSVFAWVKEMKEAFPQVKIMCVDHSLRYWEPEVAKANGHLVWPLTEQAQINTMHRSAVITRDNPNYALAEGLDVATKNIRGVELANVLRDMLGVARLQEVKQGRGAA